MMVLYDEQVKRLVAKNDQPLSSKDAAKEEQNIRRLSRSTKMRTTTIAGKRIAKQEKEREEGRQFVAEVSRRV